MKALLRRVLNPIVELRDEELVIAAMMFAYSFLAMAAYNIVQPITRSRFISALGADNLPYVLLVSVFVVGLIMQGYSKLGSLMPGRWVIPVTQAGIVLLLAAFWSLAESGWTWVEVAFYLFGQIYGLLLISQFWTLANIIFDPRQAKRVFGFIGGGASLGGIAGGSLTALFAKSYGNRSLMLMSAGLLAICAIVVVLIERAAGGGQLEGLQEAGKEEGVSGAEAIRMLRESRHLQIIATVIALTSIGAGLIDQQLNMATEAERGGEGTDAMTVVLANVQVYTSMIGFVIQVWLTSKIQRYLGIGFALLILPVGFGATAGLILVSAQLWAPMFARVLDKSLRYTVDKTSREILFLPLPPELKHKAKPFVDVTVDRVGRALQALLLLVLIKPWGLNLGWPEISYASLVVLVLWIAMAIRAKRGYLAAFRSNLDTQRVRPEELRLGEADLSTVETLVEELGAPEPRRVVYAIEMLESLGKSNLVTPLLLGHESAEVRARALSAAESARPEVRGRWAPGAERLLKDSHPDVRAAAARALAAVRGEEAAGLMRRFLTERDPRLVVTASVVLASSADERDRHAAEDALERLADDTREAAVAGRIEVAQALGSIKEARFHRLLVPLMYDADRDVALAAIRSAGRLGEADYLFVPSLISLLRNRLLKPAARDVLVGYGEGVVDTLAYFLRDTDEDLWVRRHIPGTLALIPCQKTLDVLVETMVEPDGFLRYKAIGAIGRVRRERPELVLKPDLIEQQAVREASRYLTYLSLHYNLVHNKPVARGTLLDRALSEKLGRGLDRVYRLLSLMYPPEDIAAARWSIEKGDARIKASAAEYLDNILSSTLRKRVMPVLEDMPLDEKVRRGNVLLKTRVRDAEESLAQLVHDEDQVVAAATIQFIESHEVWSLADDLEYALEHRDAKDWYVFESASWALAARRMAADERRNRWLEPLPAVELADRIRQLPLFTYVSVDELFRIAGAGRQVRFERGQVLCDAGTHPEALQILLDGQVEREAAGVAAEVTGPAAFLFDEVFEGRPAAATYRASSLAITLALSSKEFLGLLAENSDLAQGLFRMGLEQEAGMAGPIVSKGVAPVPDSVRTADGMQGIERVLLLEGMPIFAKASPDQLSALAGITREVKLVEGRDLFKEGDLPAIHIVLSGEIALEPMAGGEPAFASSGDTVGAWATLCGVASTGWRAHVTRTGVTLRIEREALMDLLADEIALLQSLFSALKGRTGRAEVRG